MDLINQFSLTVSASDQAQMFKWLGQEGNVGYQPIIMGSNYMFFRSGLATASFNEDGTIPFPTVRGMSRMNNRMDNILDSDKLTLAMQGN